MICMDVDTALSEVPVNYMPLIDDTDFKTREESVVYNQAGLDLVWNFITTAGAFTQTAVTPTTAGDYDWTNQGNGIYTIEIPASGGASINNDTEGYGWFTGYATGILPWSGPVICFRAAGINDKLVDSAYDTNRGLAGTALPAAAADGAGGLPISDAGGLALDTLLGYLDAAITTRLASAGYTAPDNTNITNIHNIVNHADYGNAQLVRSTTPANKLDVSATGEAGLDFDNIKDATGAHTLTNITVPTVTTTGTCTTNTDMRGTDNAATEAKQDIIDTVVDAIKLVTDNLPNSGALTDIDTGVNNIEAKLPSKTYLSGSTDADGGIDATEIAVIVAALNNISTSQVNAEVVDALNTDTYAEPGQGAPGATISLAAKINYIYKWLRNKSDNDGTTVQHYDDAGTTVDQKRTVSEAAGTVTKGEMETGP